MTFKKTLLAASTAFVVAVAAQPASARVVCNRWGDCWQTNVVVRYPRDLGIRIYTDRYADQAYRERRWRRYHREWREEHHDSDRGYYREGVWVPIEH